MKLIQFQNIHGTLTAIPLAHIVAVQPDHDNKGQCLIWTTNSEDPFIAIVEYSALIRELIEA